MPKTKMFAQMAMYGGALATLSAAFSELQKAESWAHVWTPSHVFGFAGALVLAIGAFMHPAPSGEPKSD